MTLLNSVIPSMEEKTAQIDAICRAARILPVVTIDSEEQILPMADALAAGGLRTLEITLRSAHGLTAIRVLRKERPDLCIGAGTILDPQMYQAAEEAGAQFIVSPGCTAELLRFAVDSRIPFLPGAGGASDLMLGYGMGYRRFKLFPAEACGGIPALKALGGPFNQVRFCPTGGVKPDNLLAYMAVPNVMCVGGSWMLDNAWTKAGDWAKVTQVSREALALLDA
ncbi:bifunctional 4-hydroxy-2-oxoglutarate aldolase/2-dehydro-3-deoxy-phosphogluconate aldolase [Pseudomonas turukhanskensis]|uniref:2-dehydro-3-deoxy-phosphogluconate aldolase n=1 Tax=Pseudomonas turukhanskensis TaxID=1806536 RepID=A0A9W6K6Z7_9PSED|nr:bifunctional 4-hydroxy-2-oxoglutarate aldolase/2-dehydro-3-deoxy-phosphogluconate aldolase [Pseudomonas turukhanskensis]GLK88639.1 ketohydroxyglutarate aldolase [Pseudomonas turukhanskensis]